jgi:hypothetical protein
MLGGKVFGNELDGDDELRTTIERTLRNLIRGMQSQFTPERFSALPRWVRDDPTIARRVRFIPAREAAE